jgi:UDPglucose--hexose-1-phosphate uridylyltransferase
MPANEMRRDYLLNRWVVIAIERKMRPTDFTKRAERRKAVGVCPFCPGHEHMTPPATLVYISTNGEIKKDKDLNGLRHKNWLVRCVPNLYPAFTPPDENIIVELKKTEVFAVAHGHHEIVIESPMHDEHPGVARITQLVHAINAHLDRLRYLSSKDYVEYVSIFRNHGLEAGASLSHPHSQLVAMPFIPRVIDEEMKASDKFWKRKKKCVYCEILRRERKGPRFIHENDNFAAFAPFASVNPFEFWILPKNHSSSIIESTREEVKGLAEILRVSLGGMRSLLKDPPYNYGFHIAPTSEEDHSYFHWHLEVYPKLSIWAGFEKSMGVFINTIPPEDAAESLRGAIRREIEIT